VFQDVGARSGNIIMLIHRRPGFFRLVFGDLNDRARGVGLKKKQKL